MNIYEILMLIMGIIIAINGIILTLTLGIKLEKKRKKLKNEIKILEKKVENGIK